MTSVAAAAFSTPLALGAHARELLERDRWPREQLLEFQRERLRHLLRHAVDRSPYFRDALGRDAEEADLAQLPTLPKPLLMEHFDRIVTDPRVRLGGLDSFLDSAAAGEAYLGEFRVFSTSGTSGTPGIFVYSQQEFAHWAAVFLRSLALLGITAETRLAGIGAPSSLHLSRQIIAVLPGAGTGAPLLSVTTPLDEMVAALNAYQPEALGGYASVIGVLAEEQLQGRLVIAPSVVFTASEVLTEDAAGRIASAWTKPVQGYFSTEVGVIASGSLDHVGLHVCEEAIVEVVDERGRPVPPGTAGSKVLLTNLVNRVQPLIPCFATQPRVACQIGFAPPLSGRSRTREPTLACWSRSWTRSSERRDTLRSSSWSSQRCRPERRIALSGARDRSLRPRRPRHRRFARPGTCGRADPGAGRRRRCDRRHPSRVGDFRGD